MLLRPSTAGVEPDGAISLAHPHSTGRSSARAGLAPAPQIPFTLPRTVRLVKDIVWLAVISMTLAAIAVLAGIIDVFVTKDLAPFSLGAGLGSVTFSVLALTDRMTGRS